MTTLKKKRILITLGTCAVLIGTCIFLIQRYIEEANKNACIVMMNSVNKAIMSQGIYPNTDEIWADPELTKAYLMKDHPEFFDMPCPSGGTHTLKYRNSQHSFLPHCVCSLESQGHIADKTSLPKN